MTVAAFILVALGAYFLGRHHAWARGWSVGWDTAATVASHAIVHASNILTTDPAEQTRIVLAFRDGLQAIQIQTKGSRQ